MKKLMLVLPLWITAVILGVYSAEEYKPMNLPTKGPKPILNHAPVLPMQLVFEAGTFWLGMTDEEARTDRSHLDSINRSVGSWGVHEQWVYSGFYLYFKNGILTSWQE